MSDEPTTEELARRLENMEQFLNEDIPLDQLTDKLSVVAQRLRNLAAERDRLREIVDELPVTDDGVEITPGMEVFVPRDDGDPPDCFTCDMFGPWPFGLFVKNPVYSTEEAAQQAAGGDG